jgi:hypothetical protein
MSVHIPADGMTFWLALGGDLGYQRRRKLRVALGKFLYGCVRIQIFRMVLKGTTDQLDKRKKPCAQKYNRISLCHDRCIAKHQGRGPEQDCELPGTFIADRLL